MPTKSTSTTTTTVSHSQQSEAESILLSPPVNRLESLACYPESQTSFSTSTLLLMVVVASLQRHHHHHHHHSSFEWCLWCLSGPPLSSENSHDVLLLCPYIAINNDFENEEDFIMVQCKKHAYGVLFYPSSRLAVV